MKNKKLLNHILEAIQLNDPLPLNLVVAGQKPSTFITINFNKNISIINYKLFVHPEHKHVFLFIEQRGHKSVNIMIFNELAISKILPLLNKSQSTYRIKSAKAYIKIQRAYYKHRNLDKDKRSGFMVITGIGFGYPAKGAQIFAKEILSGNFRDDRIAYATTYSGSLVFIGYPSTHKESEKLVRKWNIFFKKMKR